MIRITCEWDIGCDNMVFTSKEKAREWLETHAESNLPLEEGDTIDTLFEEGLLGFETLTVY
jgi:hypothetical protein